MPVKSLKSKLKKLKPKKPRSKEPLWKGPEVDGITQSMLSRFIVCRERFRLRVVEGLAPPDTFNYRIEYGQMWHLCGESPTDWKLLLRDYARNLCKKYPLQQEQISHWYQVCKVQFPVYVDYWKKHESKQQRRSLFQEEVFDVWYKLPSGRVVRLRGKWDELLILGAKRNAGIYLQENKSKGNINEVQIRRQMQFDLQTMFYFTALLKMHQPNDPPSVFGAPIRGVIYNCIRRPLSGGKGSIRRHKATSKNPEETVEAFYNRLEGIIREDPDSYFFRWKVEITQEDVDRFAQEFLNPILESLCDWYEIVVKKSCVAFMTSAVHYRTPFGIYNILAEGGSTDVDEYLATRNEVGLVRGSKLFRELE